jgi:hypothetical protein
MRLGAKVQNKIIVEILMNSSNLNDRYVAKNKTNASEICFEKIQQLALEI